MSIAPVALPFCVDLPCDRPYFVPQNLICIIGIRKGGRTVRILLADDEPEILNLYGEMLRGNGYDVTKAEDGRDVLDRIAEQDYDLLVLDLYMPNIDGFDAISRLREGGQDIPIIVMTGHYPDEEVQSRIQGLNVAQFLRKPVMITTLLNAVNCVFPGRE